MEIDNRKKRRQHRNVGLIKRRVQREIAKRIERKEKGLGRPLTKKERNEITDQIIKGMGLRLVATVIAAGTMLGVGIKNADKQALPPSNGEQHQITTEEPDKGDTFKDGLKFEIVETESELPLSKIENEINNIKNTEELLRWYKSYYIDRYKEITGDDEYIAPSSIEIRSRIFTKIAKTTDGEYMALRKEHWMIEDWLARRGIACEKLTGGTAFMITKPNNGFVIDCALGDNKVTMADEEGVQKKVSVLAGMHDITVKFFKLIDLYSELEEKPGNEYIGNIINEIKQELIDLCMTHVAEIKAEQQNQDGFEITD